MESKKSHFSQQKDHFFFSSESVGEGHPDKMCDQVSDGILDACLRFDPKARVAMETAAKSNLVSAISRLRTSCLDMPSRRSQCDQGLSQL